LGTLAFDVMHDKLHDIVAKFADAVAPKKVQSVCFNEYEGDIAIDAHTRYFTERRHAPHEKHLPFGPDVDPVHALDILRGSTWIHAAENQVEYMVKRFQGDGRFRYDPMLISCPASSFILSVTKRALHVRSRRGT
jgi:hypothetical protein